MLVKFIRQRSILTFSLVVVLLLTAVVSCSVNNVPQNNASFSGNTTAYATLDIKSFVAEPKRIKVGEPTTLTWNVTGATSISIEPDTGSLPGVSGSATIAPQWTTLYTLKATDGTNETTSKVLILVESKDGSLIWPVTNTDNVTEQSPYEGWIYYPNKYVEWLVRDSYKYPDTEDSDFCQQFGWIANYHDKWTMTDVFITNIKIADNIRPGQKLEYSKSVNCKFPTLKWKWQTNK